MHTETYCTALPDLDPVPAVRAIHQAYLQLAALTNNVDCQHYDNWPAMADLAACLRAAGHVGFTC